MMDHRCRHVRAGNHSERLLLGGGGGNILCAGVNNRQRCARYVTGCNRDTWQLQAADDRPPLSARDWARAFWSLGLAQARDPICSGCAVVRKSPACLPACLSRSSFAPATATAAPVVSQPPHRWLDPGLQVWARGVLIADRVASSCMAATIRPKLDLTPQGPSCTNRGDIAVLVRARLGAGRSSITGHPSHVSPRRAIFQPNAGTAFCRPH
jgi:hypothetical protein